LILFSAYLTFQLATESGVPPILTIAITVPLMFVVGAAIQWGYKKSAISEFNSLLVSFGLLIIIVQTISNIWSADFRRMDATVNPFATEAVSIGRLVFPLPTLLAFGFAVVLVVAAHLVIERTYPGRAPRAFAHDPQMAAAMGIDHGRLGMLLAGASAASAAVAGMLFAVGTAVTPDSAFEWVGIVFAVVILGGIGNVVGTLVAGALVGAVAGVVSVVWSPSTAPFVVFSLVVLALLFRPDGLFRRRGVT
jgi:branched-chain amino acid transport system permease protein